MITGFTEDNIAKEARSYGVDILRKPVRFQTLAAIIRARSRQHINAKKLKKYCLWQRALLLSKSHHALHYKIEQ